MRRQPLPPNCLSVRKQGSNCCLNSTFIVRPKREWRRETAESFEPDRVLRNGVGCESFPTAPVPVHCQFLLPEPLCSS